MFRTQSEDEPALSDSPIPVTDDDDDDQYYQVSMNQPDPNIVPYHKANNDGTLVKPTDDTLTALIADGRVRKQPIHHFGFPTVITVDLEALHATLVTRLRSLFLINNRLCQAYSGPHATQMIEDGITSYVDYLIGQIYNKLRSILMKHPQQRSERMKHRCPVPTNQEFPKWISSTLSCIGPLRIDYGPRDQYICYASSAATMIHYGRAAATTYDYGRYLRLHNALRECNVTMIPFDHVREFGSFYTTIDVDIASHIFSANGTVHPSHYEKEDVIRAAFVCSELGVMPFEYIGMTIGYVDDKATLDAIAALDAPAGIPAGQTAESPGRPVCGCFNVNYYGIQPEVPASGNTPGRNRGVYIIGRGVERYYQCSLARDISLCGLWQIFYSLVFA